MVFFQDLQFKLIFMLLAKNLNLTMEVIRIGRAILNFQENEQINEDLNRFSEKLVYFPLNLCFYFTRLMKPFLTDAPELNEKT